MQIRHSEMMKVLFHEKRETTSREDKQFKEWVGDNFAMWAARNLPPDCHKLLGGICIIWQLFFMLDCVLLEMILGGADVHGRQTQAENKGILRRFKTLVSHI